MCEERWEEMFCLMDVLEKNRCQPFDEGPEQLGLIQHIPMLIFNVSIHRSTWSMAMKYSPVELYCVVPDIQQCCFLLVKHEYEYEYYCATSVSAYVLP